LSQGLTQGIGHVPSAEAEKNDLNNK
jgi:hypothetical protein